MEQDPEIDVIEKGFALLIEKIQEAGKKKEELSSVITGQRAALLERMAISSEPIVKRIGLSMLEKGKLGNDGEIYDRVMYKQKMLVLGKIDPMPYRPDDATKKVVDQFCVISEEAKFYELMYSSDGFRIDSYRHAVTPAEALSIYGYEIMFMLYRAMHDYLEGDQKLIDALELTISFVFNKDAVTSSQKEETQV